MALVVGTNCGFVTVAPSADPDNLQNTTLDNRRFAGKHTSPATATKITEIGWWCNNATPESNFEVGIYAHGSGYPGAVVGSLYQTNAKGTTSGWKKVTVDITIEPETIYWIAVQLDNTATTTIDALYGIGLGRTSYVVPATNLPASWGVPTDTISDYIIGIYAVWEAGAAGWTGKIMGVTNPAKINGIAVADIEKVTGVS